MEKLFKKIIYSENILLKPIFYILVGLSYIYKFFIVRKRKKGYRITFPENFIISIGNITLGGTGKTPLTIFLSGILSKKYKVAIIMRGYKGKYKNPHLVNVSVDTPDEVGDEAIEIAKNTGIPVIIAKSRAEGIRFANINIKPGVIILDDAFQHFTVKRDVNIVLIDYSNPFGNGKLLPAGILREPIEALRDADYVLITKYEKDKKARFDIFELISKIKNINKDIKIFKAGYVLDGIYMKGKKKNIKDYVHKNILAISGIGNPEYFEFMIKKYLKPKKFTSLRFSDHIKYTEKIRQKIFYLLSKNQQKFIVTTEKDYVKLEKFNIQQLLVMKIKFKIFLEKSFIKAIINDIESN